MRNLSSTKKTVILAAVTILMLLLCCGLVLYSEEKSPQVVLVVDHSADGKIWVVPKAQVHFVFVPADPEQHLAPLPDKTNMLCRAHDVHNVNGTFMGFRCGMDDYLVYAVGIKSEGK